MRLSVAAAAREAPDRIAIIDGPTAITWREASEAIRGLTMPARGVREITPGIDTSSVLSIFAALADETALVVRYGKRPRPRTPAPRLPAGAIAIESSGTTSRPRLVVHTREALLAHCDASAQVLGSEEDDRWLVCLPLAHVSGLAPLVRALVYRRAVILEPRFDPARIISVIEERRATLVPLVPTMLADLLACGWQCPKHVRAVLIGGAHCPAPLLERARDAGVPLRVVYGMTETFSHIAIDGHPLPGVELRLEPSGVLAIRAASATTWPEWLVTHDLADLDDAGGVTIRGRADAVIISGGENVSPEAVEHALLDVAGVRAAAVTGIADERWGQLVCAAVVLEPGVDIETIEAAVKTRLAPFEQPRRYLVIGELPTLANGKLDRLALPTLFGSPPTN